MLEKVISDLLNSLLGQYIENIDRKQLGSSIISGKLELNDMRLKKTLFDDSNLPFKLAYGLVGRIYMKIPFWDMFTSPLIIEIEDIFGLVQLIDMEEWDANKEVEKFQHMTQYLLEQFENQVKQAAALKVEELKHKQSGGASYTETLIKNIVDNLQIKIKNIYFRYEDALNGKTEDKFALGLTLKEFSVCTCNSLYKNINDPKNVLKQEPNGLIYKRAKLRGFSLFCDWENVGQKECEMKNDVNYQKLDEQDFKRQQIRNGQITDPAEIKLFTDDLLENNEFKRILENEFGKDVETHEIDSDDDETAYEGNAHHKYLIENFTVTLKVQFNNDVKDPSIPANKEFPLIQADIMIGTKKMMEDLGSREADEQGQQHGLKSALKFSLYQPQILKISKVIEMVGHYNYFQNLALEFITDKKFRIEAIDLDKDELTDDENTIKDYLDWYERALIDPFLLKGEEDYEENRKRMIKIENTATFEEISKLRQIVLDIDSKGYSNTEKQQNIVDLKKEMEAQLKQKKSWFNKDQNDKVQTEIWQKFKIQRDEEWQRHQLKDFQGRVKYAVDIGQDSEAQKSSVSQSNNQSQEDADSYEFINQQEDEEEKLERKKRELEQLEYVHTRAKVEIPGLKFTMFNEFRQKLFVFELANMNLSILKKEKVMKAYLNLEDFEIQDHWSHGQYVTIPNQNRWPCLLEVKEDIKLDDRERLEIVPTEQKENLKDHDLYTYMHKECNYNHDFSVPMALNIKYEQNEDFKECPFKLRVRGQKSLYVVVIVPLINEIMRTLDNAFENQKINLDYYKDQLDARYQQAKNAANQYAEAIQTGDYQHMSYDIDVKINAPVLIIPENTFIPNSNYISLNVGKIILNTTLQEYDQDIKYSEYTDDQGLYDEYMIALQGMCLSLCNAQNSKYVTETALIDDISITLKVQSCLSPKHEIFPTIRVNIEIERKIEMELNLMMMKKFFSITDQTCIQMERQELVLLNKNRRIIKNQHSDVQLLHQNTNIIREEQEKQDQKLIDMKKKLDHDINQKKLKINDILGSRILANHKKSKSMSKDIGQISSLGQINSSGVPLESFSGKSDNALGAALISKMQETIQQKVDRKREKFKKDQEEKKRRGEGSNMEIVLRINSLILNITGDPEFYKNLHKKDKKEEEDPDKCNSEEPLQSFVSLELKGFQAFCKFDNNQLDQRMDFMVYSLMIKETQSLEQDSKQLDNKLDIYKRILSSPNEDEFYIDEDDHYKNCGMLSPREEQNQQVPENILDSTRIIKKKNIRKGQRSFNWDEILKNEPQLFVRLDIHYSEYFDEEFGEVFEDTDMDINVSISRSRIIVNMPTVGNLINVYNELIRSYFKMEYTYNERVLENRINMLQILPKVHNEKRHVGPYFDEKVSQQSKLINRIYENLAESFGYKVNEVEQYKEFIKRIQQVLEAEAEQFAFNNRLENTDTYARLHRDIDKDFKGSSNLGNLTERRSSSQVKLLRGLSIEKSKTKGDQKISKLKNKDANNTTLGTKGKFAHGVPKSSFFDQKDEQNSKSGISSIQEEESQGISFNLLNKSKDKEAERLQKEKDDQNLYIHQAKWAHWKMIVTVKLKNIDLWVMDYRNNPNDMAQIMQLRSHVDIIYDYDGIYKELMCSKKKPQPVVQSLVKVERNDQIQENADKMEEEKVDSFLKEYRYMRQDSYILINLSEISIDQLIVQTWYNVQHVVYELNNQSISKSIDESKFPSYVDHEDISFLQETLEESHHCSDDDEYQNSQGLSQESSIDGIQFNKSQILSPTCISITMNTPFSDYKKARIYDNEIKCEPLQLSLDYLDIDLIYYFNQRYAFTIAPAWAHYMAPYDFIPEEVGSEKVDSKKSDFDREEEFLQTEKEPNLLNDSISSPISKQNDISYLESPKNQNGASRGLSGLNMNFIKQTCTTEDQDVDYYMKLRVGELVKKNEAETFETDVFNFNILVESITILVRDGEIEHYIDSTKYFNKSQISPIIEVVIDDLQYITQTNTIKERLKGKHSSQHMRDINSAKSRYMVMPVEKYINCVRKQKEHNMPYSKQTIKCGLYATYFNIMSQAFEPFIEPWNVQINGIKHDQHSIEEFSIKVEDRIELIITYGMAVQIREVKQRILDKTLNQDQSPDKKQEEKKQENQSPEQDLESDDPLKLKQTEGDQMKFYGDSAKQSDWEKSPEPVFEPLNKSPLVSPRDFVEINDQILKVNKKRSGYTFLNYTGAEFRFSVSSSQINDNLDALVPVEDAPQPALKLIRQSNYRANSGDSLVEDEESPITSVKGQRYNKIQDLDLTHKSLQYFEEQVTKMKRMKQLTSSQSQTQTTDFIEDEVWTIDLKINGIKKLKNIFLDEVGVYSFSSELDLSNINSESRIGSDRSAFSMKAISLDKKKVDLEDRANVIVNITTISKQKTISIESQLMIANNQQQEICLVFEIKQINENSVIPDKIRRHSKKFIMQGKKLERSTNPHKILKQVKKDSSQDLIKIQKSENRTSVNRHGFENVHKSLDEQPTSIKKKAQSGPEQVNLIDSQDILSDDDKSHTFNTSQEDIVDQDGVEKYSLKLLPGDIFRVPLMWLIGKSEVDLKIKQTPCTDKDGNFVEPIADVFNNLAQIFNKCGKEKNSFNFCQGLKSKIIELNEDFYTTVDIQGYTCLPRMSQRDNPLQYVISFNPPLMFTNYIMNPLEIWEIDNPGTRQQKSKLLHKIPPSMSQYIIQLDMSRDNKSEIKFTINDTVQDCKLTTLVSAFNSPVEKEQNDVRQNQTTIVPYNFMRHKTNDEFQRNMDEDGNELEICQMQIEIVKKLYSELKNYNQNFDFRERLIDIGIAVKMMIYPKHMIVNKSEYDIFYLSGKKVKSKYNDFLMSEQDNMKLKFYVKNYSESKFIDINTIGLSGTFTLTHRNPKNMQQRQFGIAIMQASYPYNKTTIITIVPRYLVINKLNQTIQIRQYLPDALKKQSNKGEQVIKSRKQTQYGQKIYLNCGEKDNQKELHLKKFSRKKNTSNLIQFKTMADHMQGDGVSFITDDSDFEQQDNISSSSKNLNLQDKIDDFQKNHPHWTEPFQVDEMDDFQTESKIYDPNQKGSVGSASDLQNDMNQALQWFQPQRNNNHKQFTRVIVTQNPTDNNASILIIFDEPSVKEFMIVNNSETNIEYQRYDPDAERPINRKGFQVGGEPRLNESIVLKHGSEAPFVWDSREHNSNKHMRVFIEGLEFVIPLKIDQSHQEETNLVPKMFDIKNNQMNIGTTRFTSRLSFNQEGTQILTISKKQSRSKIQIAQMGQIVGKALGGLESQVMSKSHYFKKFTKIENEKDKKKDNQKFISRIPSKDSKGLFLTLQLKGFGLSVIDQQPKELLYLSLSELYLQYDDKSTQTNFHKNDNIQTDQQQEVVLRIGSFQLDNMINDEMPVVIGAKRYFPKNLIQRQTFAPEKQNIADFYKTVEEEDIKKKKRVKRGWCHKKTEQAQNNEENQPNYQQDSDDDEFNEPYKKKEENYIPFILLELQQTKKSYSDRIGSVIRIEKMKFGMQEFFIQIESNILNDNLKFVQETLQIFMIESEEDKFPNSNDVDFEKALQQKRKDACPMVDASNGVKFDATKISVDKMSFRFIQIITIKASLTFKLEKKVFDFDFSNPRAMFGLFGILYPFISNFASITDSDLIFNELVMIEGYYSKDNLFKNIINHYLIQGTQQMWRIFGNSDMIGNPIGLITKMGSGIYILARDPILGIQEGPEEFFEGIGTGFQGVVRGVIGGSLQSVAAITGTLYKVIKESTGGKDLRKRKQAKDVYEGLVFGFYGIFIEIFDGFIGFFMRPYNGYEQRKFKGCYQGCGEGIAGMICGPATGALRATQSISQGLAGTANNFSNIGKTKIEILNTAQIRVRPPRRIHIGQIRIFDEDIAIINSILSQNSEFNFSSQQLRMYVVLPVIDQHGKSFEKKKSLLILTNDFIIYYNLFNFFDQEKQKVIKKSLLMYERLTNIVNYSLLMNEESSDSTKVDSEQDFDSTLYFLDIVFQKTHKHPFDRDKNRAKKVKQLGRKKHIQGGAPMPLETRIVNKNEPQVSVPSAEDMFDDIPKINPNPKSTAERRSEQSTVKSVDISQFDILYEEDLKETEDTYISKLNQSFQYRGPEESAQYLLIGGRDQRKHRK